VSLRQIPNSSVCLYISAVDLRGVEKEGGGYHYVTVGGHSEARECRRTAAQSLHLVSEPEASVSLGLLGKADANPFIAVSVTHAFVFLTDVG